MPPPAIDAVDSPRDSGGRPRSTGPTCGSRPASSSPCSVRAARARPPCCGSSPGSRYPTPGTVAIGGPHGGGRRACGSSPSRRRVGMVFQDGALFPHLTVAGNVAFGAPARRRGSRECLELVGPGGTGSGLPARAVRRRAPAGRAGPGAGRRPRGRAARRAVRRAGRGAAGGAARGGRRDPAGRRGERAARHPRPGGGAVARRRRRGDARRPGRAGRVAGGRLRARRPTGGWRSSSATRTSSRGTPSTARRTRSWAAFPRPACTGPSRSCCVRSGWR